jgi:hypothetical protein
MKNILNIVTGKKSIISDFSHLSDSEVLLHSHFARELIATQDYGLARKSLINSIVKEKDLKQPIIDTIGGLRGKYFSADVSSIRADVNSALVDYSHEAIVTDPANDLCNYLVPIVKGMSDATFSSLVDISNQLPDLIYFVLQPAFILALGIKTFMLSIPILMHAGNFAKLLAYCKSYRTGVSLGGLYSSMISLAKPYLLKGSFFVTVPFIIYSLAGYYSQGPAKSSTLSREASSITFNSFRMGGDISRAVDKVASLLRQAGSEVSVLTGSFFHGYINEFFFKASGTADNDK